MRFRGRNKIKAKGYAQSLEAEMEAKKQEARIKKPRQQKWWSMSMLSIPVMKMLKSQNQKIDEARIASLENRVEHKKKLARAHLEAGREGKANKMANQARANEREIRKIEMRV